MSPCSYLFVSRAKPMFTDDFIRQLVAHVHVYAELLLRWQMYEKRIHLLKAVNKRNHVREENKGAHHQIGGSSHLLLCFIALTYQFLGIVQTCTHCGQPLRDKSLECHACHVPRTMSLCSICRLPVKGSSIPPSDHTYSSFIHRSVKKLSTLQPRLAHLLLEHSGSTNMPNGVWLLVHWIPVSEPGEQHNTAVHKACVFAPAPNSTGFILMIHVPLKFSNWTCKLSCV